MLPWNWLAPALFGWREIRFLQALGPLAVTQVLFGGFRGRHGPRSHGRRTLDARWNEMTPKERDNSRRECNAARDEAIRGIDDKESSRQSRDRRTAP